jgi:modulator of FtsH protease HflC
MSFDERPSLAQRISGNPAGFLFMGVLLLVLFFSTVKIVPETQQALVIRLSQPNRVINKYHANETYGQTGAGLVMVIPFIEDVVWVDKQVLDVDMDKQQVLSTDQRLLDVDAYARYRIVDPLRMYVTARNPETVTNQLKLILGSALRNELGKVHFAALLSPDRSKVMDEIQAGLDRVARQYGAEIVDVRIKRAELPDGPLQSAFESMRTARQQEARAIEADGNRQALIMRADADAAAAKRYAEAFGKDPNFYDFYRAMKSYRTTFAENSKGATEMILSPSNDYLREFRGGK